MQSWLVRPGWWLEVDEAWLFSCGGGEGRGQGSSSAVCVCVFRYNVMRVGCESGRHPAVSRLASKEATNKQRGTVKKYF